MGRVRGLVVMLGRMRRLVADAVGVSVVGRCWSRENGYGSQGGEAEGEESGDTHFDSWMVKWLSSDFVLAFCLALDFLHGVWWMC